MLNILQTILAAPNSRQGSSWTRLLFIIAIAAVYGIKTLIKAKKSFIDNRSKPDKLPISRQRQGGQGPEWVKPKFTMVQKKRSAPEPVKVEVIPEAEPVKRKSLIPQEPEAEQQRQLQPDITLELDLDDTDSLRRAIIYSEILGKPVAMRQGV